MGFTIVDIVVWMLSVCCQIPHLEGHHSSHSETAGTNAPAGAMRPIITLVAQTKLAFVKPNTMPSNTPAANRVQ